MSDYSNDGIVTSVASSASAGTLLAGRPGGNRKGASIFNDSTAVLYVYLSGNGTPTTSLYTVQVPAGGYYETPYKYCGTIKGIWASANGSARVTEYV